MTPVRPPVYRPPPLYAPRVCPIVALSALRGPHDACLTFPADLALSGHQLAPGGMWRDGETHSLPHTYLTKINDTLDIHHYSP